MSLPNIADIQPTRVTLHQASQILLSARLLGLDPLPNHLRHSLIPTPTGVSTGELNFGGELVLDFAAGAIRYVWAGETTFSLDLAGRSQISLYETVYQELKDAGVELHPDVNFITEQSLFEFNADAAIRFNEMMWRMFNTLARVKVRFLGFQTPLVLWSHGFDLSTLWFPSGFDEDVDPHLNIGFSPGTPDVGQPYIYFYAYPAPSELPDLIPDAFEWNENWHTPGGVLKYDHIKDESDPESTITDLLIQVYDVVKTMI